MPQHFIKIEIKGESDLPKEVGRYETCCKGDLRYVYWEGTPDDKDYWMLNVDYYFLPVPEPQQPEQPDSAETWLKNRSDYDNIEGAVDIQWLINLLTEFSQSHNNTVVGPTEEKVMSYFNLHCRKSIGLATPVVPVMTRSDVIAMTEWFRSQVREVELKGELVKHRKWFDKNSGNYSIHESDEKIVDDYLSARKEGENER